MIEYFLFNFPTSHTSHTSHTSQTKKLLTKSFFHASEEIESVDVYTPYIIAPTQYEIIGINTYSDGILECKAPAITLTEKEDIELLQKLHLTAIENNEKETNDGLKIEYHLKDGSTIRRNYFYLSEKASNEVLKLWDTKEIKSNYELILLNKGYDNPVSVEELNHYYSNYLENKEHLRPVTKPFFMGWHNARIRIGLWETAGENMRLREVGVIHSGISDEMKKDMSEHPENYMNQVCSIQMMEVDSKAGTIRHGFFKYMRPDKDSTSCRFEDVFGQK
jgi:hypothetical protein